jgi:hypothetical protein
MTAGEHESRNPLPKILQVMGVLAVFMSLGYLTLRGLSVEELMLPAVALGLPIYLIVLVDPILGIAILIASIGLSPEFTVGGVRDLRAEDFLMPGLVLGWLLRTGQKGARFAPAVLWRPALISFGVMVLTTLAGAPGRYVSPSMPYLIVGKYVEYVVLYLLVLNTVKTEAEIRALTIFSILVAVTSAVLTLGGSAYVVANPIGNRLTGPMGETANIFGGYLGLHLLLALGLFLHSTTSAARLAWGGAAVVLGFAILYTYSRGTYVALGGALLIFGLVKARRLLLILFILAAIIPVMAPTAILDRLQTVGGVASGTSPGSWTARVDAWEWAVRQMTGSDWFYGKGIGSVAFGDVDSEYVRVLSDMGVLGMALFAWVLIRLGRMANRTHDALPNDTFLKGTLAGYMMAYISMLIHAVAATSFSAIRIEEGFMILTALANVVANGLEEARLEGEDRPVVLLRDASILGGLRQEPEGAGR